MATQFKIDSNNNIDCRGIKIKKKWNNETLQFEDSDEFYMYNQGEIKGNYVYCSLPSSLANSLPFKKSINRKNLAIDYDGGNIETFKIDLLYDGNEELQEQIRKTKGAKIGLINYIADPQFENYKNDGGYYGLIVNAYPQNVSGNKTTIYTGKYALQSWETSDSDYYIFGDLVDNEKYLARLNMKRALQIEGYNRENFGKFIIETLFRQRNHLFFDKAQTGGVNLPNMKINVLTNSLEGNYQANDGDGEIGKGVGYGTIKAYNGSSNLLETYEVNNQVFRITRETDTYGNITGIQIKINGSSHIYYISEYSNLYINCDLVYWNEESDIEILGIDE